jgi:hypothetical protein
MTSRCRRAHRHRRASNSRRVWKCRSVVTGMLNGGVLPLGLTPVMTGAARLPFSRFVDRAGEHLARTSTE